MTDELPQLKETADSSSTKGSQSNIIEVFAAKIVNAIQNVVKSETQSSVNSESRQIVLDDKFVSQRKKRQISLKVTPKDGVFSIHVSKFHRDATIDDVISLIRDKTDLDPITFKVVKMSNRKISDKKRVFASFKVSTLYEDSCNKIIDKNVWSPDYIASPFNHIDKSPKANDLKPSGRLKSKSKSKPNATGHTHTNRKLTKNKQQQQRGKFSKSDHKQSDSRLHQNVERQNQNQQNQQNSQNYQNYQNHPFWYNQPYYYPPPPLSGPYHHQQQQQQQHHHQNHQIHHPQIHTQSQQPISHHHNCVYPPQHSNTIY